MKTRFSKILATAAALTLGLWGANGVSLYAQNTYTQVPVEVSKEKVKVGGKLCWSHVVQERQTLYSISKAYGVAIDDIYRFNPGLKEHGLQKNAIIVIPSPEALSAKGGKQKADKVSQDAGSKAEEKTAKASSEEKTAQKEQTAPDKDAKIHVVKWFETIQTIAAKYDVSPDDIVRANNLQSTELKSKQQLTIPSKEQAARWKAERELAEAEAKASSAAKSEEKSAQKSERQEEDKNEYFSSENSIVEGKKSEEAAEELSSAPKERVSIALMLPFKSKDSKPSSSAMDFYCGALLGARTLGNEGLDLDMDVYDITDDSYPITKETISGDDFIIGPLAPADIEKIYSVVGEDKPLISPLDPKAAGLTSRYPKMIQVPTPHELQYADLVQWLGEETREGDRTVLIREKGGKESESMKSLISMLDLAGIKYSTISYSILEGRDILDRLKSATVESKAEESKGKWGKTQESSSVNRFIIASESEAFVSDVFRNIGLLKRENRDVEIFCHSKVRGYDIEVESLHNNDLHISLAYYIDYNNPEVIRFVKEYRALFNTEPTQFSFQGYDIVLYFARLCKQNGDAWIREIGTKPQSMLQTRFEFRDGSRINEGVRRIEYVSDYKINCL